MWLPSAAWELYLVLQSAEALPPAMALPMTLDGRDSIGYSDLSAPVLALGIRHPTLSGARAGSGVARVVSFVRP
jgi:hypothetical protein